MNKSRVSALCAATLDIRTLGMLPGAENGWPSRVRSLTCARGFIKRYKSTEKERSQSRVPRVERKEGIVRGAREYTETKEKKERAKGPDVGRIKESRGQREPFCSPFNLAMALARIIRARVFPLGAIAQVPILDVPPKN